MTTAAFVSTVLALLLAPGPTNTLMGIAGAQRGLARVARLLPAELAGYLTAILPLAFLGAGLLEQMPALAVGLKLAAAGWIMVLATALWRAPGSDGESRDIGARRIYVTTVLNPKALILGLVLLPAPQDPAFATRLGMFCLMVIGAALAWGCAGILAQAGNGGRERLQGVQRVASVWLAFVSISLVFGLMRV
ncbi:LysE family translocator [Paracoccus pantotrophus]|uniref:Threonine/homoserine/homoserine lactone efflux protein n=1 Tax=Paracoccus pantotrophus TaxID=82367 RepID=A0A7H9BRB8_PARPN|nr:hypothetical protein [Paracoccus pantotrophus]MDF3853042.1 hypothetical protein [Paracoccus pantotrophus]QLH13874.1 hypothetical protein HYQ43_06350 [Paracoccus pantotrophus]RDE01036.1 hypothetical protein DTW92_01400 [Paracoccus pantotrophus]RNI17506.1 hypothetical protein EB844_10275 [Paracoccus pantotrophus]WGR66993.1 hypothetical protein E3U24_17195 [Paracoccus pantotrophus]